MKGSDHQRRQRARLGRVLPAALLLLALGLTYAQAYRGQLQGLNLVDHNANPREIMARGDHLLAPLATFYIYPLPWWEEFLGQSLYLSTAAPGVVEMSLAPPVAAAEIPLDTDFIDYLFNIFLVIQEILQIDRHA